MKCCARVLCGWECLCEVLLEHGAESGEHADKQSRRRRLPILGAAAMLLVRLLGIWHKRRGTPSLVRVGAWGQTQWTVVL